MPSPDEERIALRHPKGLPTPAIRRSLYEVTRRAILASTQENPGLLFADLYKHVLSRTPSEAWTTNSVGWYTTSVKLDLEARGLLRRAGRPQALFLTDDGSRAAREQQNL